MSYVRLDDRYEEGRLTELRQRLESEVRMQTGLPFPIFQDRQDIQWGQNWKERISESLDAVTFLIPIVTPSFFQSSACRDELGTFLERETELRRGGLVLPIYYVSVPALDSEEPREDDPLLAAIRSRQFFDWRNLRFESPQSPNVGRAFEQLALHIRAALAEVEAQPARGKSAPTSRETTTPAERSAPGHATASEAGTLRQEPPTYVVDPFMRGDFASIGEAIEKAEPGSRLLVRPGSYRESLAIDKPIELIGDGDVSEIVIQGENGNAVSCSAAMGRISNLTIRQLAGSTRLFALAITQGRLEVEDCEITSQSISCVGISAGADPRLRRNRIAYGAEAGVLIYERGLGLLEENDIFGNALTGIGIREGSSPTIRRNRVHDNAQCGILLETEGQGLLEENDILSNGLAGVEVREGSHPIVRSNLIQGNKGSGILLRKAGSARLEANRIVENGRWGVNVEDSASPSLRANTINRNGQAAIRVAGESTVVAEHNDLRGNERGAWQVEKGATLQATRNEEGDLP